MLGDDDSLTMFQRIEAAFHFVMNRAFLWSWQNLLKIYSIHKLNVPILHHLNCYNNFLNYITFQYP